MALGDKGDTLALGTAGGSLIGVGIRILTMLGFGYNTGFTESAIKRHIKTMEANLMKTPRGFGVLRFIGVGVACFSVGFISAKMVYFDAHQGSLETVKVDKPEYSQVESDAVSASIDTATSASESQILAQLDQLAEGEVLIVRKDGSTSVANARRRSVADRNRIATNSSSSDNGENVEETDSSNNVPPLTRKEVATLVPEHHVSIFVPRDGARLNERRKQGFQERQDQLRQFEEKKKDTDWAYEVKSQLEVFFYSHEHSHEFKIDSIECREFACQTFGREIRKGIYSIVMGDLGQQEWFRKLRLTPSGYVTYSPETKGSIYYTFFSQRNRR